MTVKIVRNGEVVDSAEVPQYISSTWITIMTAIGPNIYKIKNIEWVVPDVVNVHVEG
jgi:hypothetical protein